MAYETIIVEVEDHVATIALNRPDALNALNSHLLAELAQALTECFFANFCTVAAFKRECSAYAGKGVYHNTQFEFGFVVKR